MLVKEDELSRGDAYLGHAICCGRLDPVTN